MDFDRAENSGKNETGEALDSSASPEKLLQNDLQRVKEGNQLVLLR